VRNKQGGFNRRVEVETSIKELSMLRWLDELTDKDAAEVGPKVARLAALHAFGIDVPDGFAVTASAFQRFLTTNDLAHRIEQELHAVSDVDNFVTIEAASLRVRNLIEQAPMEGVLEAALREAYDELCFRHGHVGLPVAVRSSATGEDAATASFAGQYESYLGVTGAEAVTAAVRKAWSSLFVARALTYRLRHRQHYRETLMGVGILRLVNARCAGVAFSAHPVSKKRDRFVIEGSWGWGESVVQGSVEPDCVEVDRVDGRTLSYRVADKRIASLLDPACGGVTEQPLPVRFQKSPCLTPDMIHALWKAISEIERRFGKPIDIEWVIEQGWPGVPLSIVQVRPITTLGEMAEPPAAKWDALHYAAKYGLGLKSKPIVTPQ
jgi:pyruvate,water dikinase